MTKRLIAKQLAHRALQRVSGQAVTMQIKCLIALQLIRSPLRNQKAIAAWFGVSQSTVSRILTKLLTHYRSEMAGAKESQSKRRDRSCLKKFNFTPDLLANLLMEKRRGGGKHRLKLGKSVEHEEFVIELLEKKGLPLTQCELAKLFEKRFKFSVHRTTVSKFLKRIGMRRKVIQKQLSRQSLTEKNLSLRRQFVQRWFAAGSFDMDKIGTVEEFADQRRWRLRPVCDGGVVDSPAQVFFIDETGCNRHTLERKHGYARAGKAYPSTFVAF